MTTPPGRPEVDRLFEQAELEAERLVALLRIGIALSLGAVFVVAVLGSVQEPTAVLVRQWIYAGSAMLGYLLLGVGSFALNARNLYRPWMAWIAVTGDCVFLIVNVWLSLLNLGISGAYQATLPAVWLAPIVLAFGALRFNPWLQAYLIAAIAGGLIYLGTLGGGATASPAADMLQIVFAPPPNVMRLAMLALAGAVLIVAAVRAKRLLRRALDETRRRLNLTRYLPRQIAGRLADVDIAELKQGDRRDMAILFVDIRGFTRRCQDMDPAALGAFLTAFRQRVGRAADANDGIVDKFVGDSALLVFGLSDRTGNPARRALDAADALHAEMASWSAELEAGGAEALRVGVGVHWGEVFFGAVGDDDRLEFTVLGDAVNIAARLEEMTKVVGWPIVISGDVLAAAGVAATDGTWRRLEPAEVRGREGALSLYGGGANS